MLTMLKRAAVDIAPPREAPFFQLEVYHARGSG
jgi:hypothetical protein